MSSNLPSNLPRPAPPSPQPVATLPAVPAVPLPRQEADFTAEGSPPPGRVGLQAPVDAAADALPAGDPAADPGADAGAELAPADELSAHHGPQAAGRTSVTPEHATAVPPAVHRAAQVVGEVQARQGDGVNIVVPPGPCVVRLGDIDATVSWGEAASGGEAHGVVAMPLTDFQALIKSGAITFDDDDASR